MSVSTCRDCATRVQLEEIKNMVYQASGELGIDDLDIAYQLISDAKRLLAIVRDVREEL